MADVLASHYMAGIVGVALLRHWYEPGADNDVRIGELETILTNRHEFPQNLTLNPVEHSVVEGYRAWSEIYDGPNPMIEQEETVTVPWLQAMMAELDSDSVRALDAGCGTGRQAKLLADLGAEVTGVDATQEMLDIAIEKIPSGDFHVGSLDAIPREDDAFDLAVSSLAICHLDTPDASVAELARCVRPGGHIVISDPHPMVSALGGQAFYGGFEGGMDFVRNRHHPLASWINAFVAADLEIVECVELGYNSSVLRTNPLRPVLENALTAGFDGLPFILCFRLRVR